MQKWRTEPDQGQSLDEAEQTDLEVLIEAEFLASSARTDAVLDQLIP